MEPYLQLEDSGSNFLGPFLLDKSINSPSQGNLVYSSMLPHTSHYTFIGHIRTFFVVPGLLLGGS